MRKHIKEIGSYWDQRSGGFSDASLEELATEPGERWREIFSRYLPSGCKVLDDGAGAGFFTLLLSEMGYETTAADYSQGMVGRIKGNLLERGLSAKVLQMDAQDLIFEDGIFDAVVSRNVLWNLEEPDKAYREISRVLKPDGILILEDGNHYLRLHNETYREAYEAFRAEHKDQVGQDCHSRHNREQVDFSIIENIARELPLSRQVRPSWDLAQIIDLGFRDIHVRIRGEKLPMNFLLIARKGSDEA